MLKSKNLKKISKVLVFIFLLSNILSFFPTDIMKYVSAETKSVESNIALGKKVEVSGIEGAKWTGDKAVDGIYTDEDSRWSSAEVTDSNSQWIYVDLEKEYSIEKVNIHWHNWAYGTVFKIQKSNDKSNWEDISTITNTVGKDEENKNLINKIPLNNVSTRYIRVLIIKRNQWTSVSIRELEVIGYEIKEGNVALGKSASVSAVENNSNIWTADKVVDGDKTTDNSRWASPSMSVEANEQDKHWININFNGEVEIDSVNIYWYKKAYAENYIIQVSSDGEVWEDVKNITHPAGNELDKIDNVKFDQTKKAKYLRVFITERNANAFNNVSIREVEVIGREKIVPEQNLTCTQVIASIESLPKINISDTSIVLPEVPKGFKIRIRGIDFENIIDKDGKITRYNINDAKVSILLEVYKENDESNNATKNIDVIVPGKSSLHPEIFKSVTNPNTEPSVIPRLQEWYGLDGKFTLNDSSRIVLNDMNNVDLNKVANLFNEDLNYFVGFKLEVAYGKEEDVKPGDIYIESITEDIYDLGKEGYFTTVNDSIKIKSSTYKGSLYGTITLLQILWQNTENRDIPFGVIRDYPKYEIRGVMLDVARMPMSINFVRDYSKILSWYKLNELHLHLNDNQWAEGNYNNPDSWNNVYDAFRLESKNHPGLKPKNNNLNDPYYTQDEYRNLESRANDYGMEVVPEIDAPAHSLTFTQYMMEKGTPIHSTKYWFDHIDIDNPLGKQLIKGLLDEFIDGENPVFSGDTVHIGIDEYDTSVGDKFKQYAADISNHVIDKGKTPRVWGSLKPYSGTTMLPEGTIIDVWNTNWEDPVARIKEGYDIVNVPQPYTYITPSRWHKDFMDTQNIYNNWEPNMFGAVTLPIGEPQLLGGKMAIWGDESMEGIVEADLHERLLPAVATLSEKTWSGTKSSKDYLKFMKTFNVLKEGPNTTVSRDVKSDSELVLKYDFENKDAVDSSSNKYNGTIKNGDFANGQSGKTLKFNGKTALETPLTSISYPYTASFDVKVDKVGEEINLFAGVDGELKVKEDGTIAIRRSFYEQNFSYKLEKGKFTNITIVGTFQALSLYVDGEFVEQLYSYRAHDNSIISGQELNTTFVLPLERIGENLKGEMDNIQIYNTVMPDEWIAGEEEYRLNYACGVDAYSSSNAYLYTKEWKAIDGNSRNNESKWVSGNSDNSWLMVDLKKSKNINEVEILFENAPSEYKVLTSIDGVNFEEVGYIKDNKEVKNNITFDMREARYIKFQGVRRGLNVGYSIIELKALGEISGGEVIVNTPDLNKDGVVDLKDLAIASSYYGKNNTIYDLNNDGIVNEYEINIISDIILGITEKE